MSWLRIDDGFAAHPKIAALTDRELRVWLRVLCYCARHQDPTLDEVTSQEIPGLNRALITKLKRLELIDVSGADYEVHDWTVYQPKDLTGATRQARWRARRNAERNGPRNGSSNADVDGPDRDENVTLTRAPAQAFPSRPVPDPSLEPNTTSSVLPSNVDVHATEEPDGRVEGVSTRRKTEAEEADQDRDHYGVPTGFERRPTGSIDVPDVLKSL